MNKIGRILLAVCCLFGLLYVRFRESELFYDPLIEYFHGDYQYKPLPELSEGKLFIFILLRYLLNTILSVGLLWAVFIDKQILKFSGLLYAILSVLLLLTMHFILQSYDSKSYLPLFYVRRFLIQPLLVFILLPAFYYARKVN